MAMRSETRTGFAYVIGRIVAPGADDFDQRAAWPGPISPFRQVGDDGELVVVEADGAGVLAARRGERPRHGRRSEARWRRSASPASERAAFAASSASSSSRASTAAGERCDLADRHGSDIPELGTVGGVHYAASSVMVSDAKSGSAPSRRGRAMAK